MPKISVILPAYNVAEHLKECLAALVTQRVDGADVELILVDNNSTDATVAIAGEFSDVRVLHQPVQGSYAARNLGVRESTGGIVVFLDPDCAPRPGWLRAAVRGLDAPKTQIVLGRRYYGPSRALALLSKYEDEKIQRILRRRCTDQVYGYTNNMAVRRALLTRTARSLSAVVAATRCSCSVWYARWGPTPSPSCARWGRSPRGDAAGGLLSQAHHLRREQRAPVAGGPLPPPLSSSQRFAVLQALLLRGRVAPWDAVVLLALLVPGAIAYDRALARGEMTAPSTRRESAGEEVSVFDASPALRHPRQFLADVRRDLRSTMDLAPQMARRQIVARYRRSATSGSCSSP